jgi:hypothetical protein
MPQDRFSKGDFLNINQDNTKDLNEFIYFKGVECEDSLYIFSKENVFRRW